MTTSASAMAQRQPADKPRAPRPLKPLVDRLLILGLDGATFYVLDPLIQAGRMPNLKRFIENGVGGVLNSTQPPITPAAWTTFMTGKGPGQHGILDFEKYEATTHTLTFNSTYEIREKTLWQHLSEKGLRVGSVNVPMTYPPKPVNGFMISGFETPSIDAQFTWPPELREDVFRLIPNYNYRTNWRRKAFGRRAQLAENIEYIANSFDQGAKLTTHYGDMFGWDVLMVVFKLVDNLQHKAWKYLDPRWTGRYPQEAEMAAQCFERLDGVLGELFEYAEKNNATVLIMSDHGHGSLDGKAQPNLLLHKWGLSRAAQRVGTGHDPRRALGPPPHQGPRDPLRAGQPRRRTRLGRRLDAHQGLRHARRHLWLPLYQPEGPRTAGDCGAGGLWSAPG